MKKADVILIVQAAPDIPALLKIAIVAFLRAMPEAEFERMTAGVFEAGRSVMSNDPGAPDKLAALGIPAPIAEKLLTEARARAQH